MMHHHDNIHGVLAIPEDIACIIRSPQFQRLKHIKQLGFLYLYLPNASCSRFEHCIGTYWLARVMLACLRKNSDWLLDDKDFNNIYAKAVEIAALLHDIGHGPFSHAWEHIAEDFQHEMNGTACVDAIFESQPPNFMPELRSNQNFGIELIKALILGDKSSLPHPIPSKYEFIFEIVNNNQCSIDVDKWDYLTRDSHYLSNLTHPPINFKDVFLNARVSSDGTRIEYAYADYSKIYEIFQARFILHKKYYRLPQNLAIERLMKRIIERSNPKLHGCDIRKINAKHSMGAFIKLTDQKVMQLVKNDKDYIYIEEPRRLKLVDEFTTDQLDLDLQSKYLIVEDTLQGPGVEMPQDHKFRFYGDKSEKAEIIRDITPIRTKYVFQFA